MMRPINFCSGPSALPLSVLARMRDELMDFQGSGISVIEHSHRDPRIVQLFTDVERQLLAALGLDVGYRALLLSGGATLQFSQLAMNLLGQDGVGAYVTTGAWSEKAVKAAAAYGTAVEIASAKSSGYTEFPAIDAWNIPEDARYVHLCTNETIHGVEWFGSVAELGLPVIADMSSHILSRRMPMHTYDLVYAGAQKNLGTAGVTLVVIKSDLLDRCQLHPGTPDVLSYAAQAAQGSMVNTPPVMSVWVLSLMLDWLESMGGVDAIEVQNRAKAALMYGAIDASGLYHNPVAEDARSWMNVPFVLADPALDAAFLAEAEAAGLLNLKGHRSVGGMRASLYNAITVSDVQVLIDFMHTFERTRG